jgi:acetolactate synthase-1/2/3 large subunit
VEYIFANLGTDHVSLIEEMARWDSEGLKHPEMILWVAKSGNIKSEQ